jgi:alpha-L-fucosidase
MDDLAAMARKHQPGLIIVDRTVGGRHENYRTPEQQVPDKPLPYVWESCLTMGDQWSYKHDDNYKSVRQLVHLLVDVVSKGGNLLLNIGPRPDGRLPDEALQRLAAIGRWMDVNSQAIHATRPVAPYKDGRVCLTSRPGAVYAIVLAADGESAPPAEVSFAAPAAAASGAFRPTSATLLGDPQAEPLPVRFAAGRLAVTVPARLVASPPCADAWVLKMAR